MTALGDHAIRELDLIGAVDPIRASTITIVGTYADLTLEQRATVLGYMNTLLAYQPLSPLTNDPADWVDRSSILGERPYWQSLRNPDAWSTDGGETYYFQSQAGQIYASEPM